MLVADESPLVLKYTDCIYKDIVEANKNSNQMRKEYLLQQPELNEPDFCKIVNEGLEKEKTNPNERFIFTCELCKYRLNKKYLIHCHLKKEKDYLLVATNGMV